MIRKILSLVICAVILTGCTAVGSDVQTELNKRLAEVLSQSAHRPFYNHTYYSYYCEPYIGRISMEETSNVFSFEGVKFVMNLKADEIINRKFYKESGEDVSDALKGGQRIAYQTGSYTDYEGKEHPFETGIYLLDGICFTVMDTDCMEFLSSGNHIQAVQTAAEMLKIARTVQVDENDVITAFSSRQTIVNNRKKLELFQNIAPESGMIQELFENEEYLKTGNEIFGDNYDTTLNTPEPEPEEITEGTIVGDELFQGEYSELFEDDEVSEDSEKNP